MMPVFSRFTLGFLACTLVFGLPSSVSAGSEKQRPLHIKISPSLGTSAHGIRIHKGKVPPSSPIREKTTSPNINALGRKGIDSDQVFDASITCAMNRKSPLPQNHAKNLADSLRAHMTKDKRDAKIIDILLDVSLKRDTDFELLVIKAMLESDLGRLTTSPTSTARGLFQYIESTWLGLIKRHGAEIGYANFADSIEINEKTGDPNIKRGARYSKSDILKLRFDPQIATMIKALQIKEETPLVQEYKDGATLNITDHYIVHMMGLKLAKDFYALKNQESGVFLAHSQNPMFREAALLNPAFFYDERGAALTATQAYSNFKTRIAQAYKRLHQIDAEYGDGQAISDSCNTMPDVPPIKVEKEMLPAKGVNFASLNTPATLP